MIAPPSSGEDYYSPYEYQWLVLSYYPYQGQYWYWAIPDIPKTKAAVSHPSSSLLLLRNSADIVRDWSH